MVFRKEMLSPPPWQDYESNFGELIQGSGLGRTMSDLGSLLDGPSPLAGDPAMRTLSDLVGLLPASGLSLDQGELLSQLNSLSNALSGGMIAAAGEAGGRMGAALGAAIGPALGGIGAATGPTSQSTASVPSGRAFSSNPERSQGYTRGFSGSRGSGGSPYLAPSVGAPAGPAANLPGEPAHPLAPGRGDRRPRVLSQGGDFSLPSLVDPFRVNPLLAVGDSPGPGLPFARIPAPLAIQSGNAPAPTLGSSFLELGAQLGSTLLGDSTAAPQQAPGAGQGGWQGFDQNGLASAGIQGAISGVMQGGLVGGIKGAISGTASAAGGQIGTAIGAAIAPALGPAAPLAPIIGGMLGSTIGSTAVEAVMKPVEQVANYAGQTAKEVIGSGFGLVDLANGPGGHTARGDIYNFNGMDPKSAAIAVERVHRRRTVAQQRGGGLGR
ncbi:hypothetical protein [Nocardia sp. NPDC051570]|uniref:hypothetical protein n=1 Tax=Nocardia sp. NPDC051570 TaxID=3364324 RepID=UPI0037AE3A46